jgi:predicted transposase YbfD/YdcC
MLSESDPRSYFADLDDPRRDTKNKLHSLQDIIFIVVSSILSGIEDWVGMQDFVYERLEWFKRFIPLANGVPSHDTISNVIGRLKPKQFSTCFSEWVTSILPNLSGHHIAIDGKALCGSDDGSKNGMTYILSAFASASRLVLAQHDVVGKGNEIAGIEEVLKMLELKGSLITIDAIGAQKNLVSQIVSGGADYVIALKGNQEKLHEGAKTFLDSEIEEKKLSPFHDGIVKDHGRIENRIYYLSSDLSWLDEETKNLWSGIESVGVVESQRTVIKTGKTTTEKRYYINSTTDIEQFASAVRQHWAIENQQHWVLDVQFREDDHIARKDHRAANLALIRRIALNLMRAHSTSEDQKRSMRRRKRLAGLTDQRREQLLFGTKLQLD